MSLSFGYSPFLLILCMALAVALSLWIYQHTVPALSPARKAVLVGLRTAVLFIVLFLLFEPILRRVQRDERAPILAVLIDESQSLSLSDDSDDSTGFDVAASTRALLDDVPFDRVNGEVRYYTFSSDLKPLDESTPFDSLQFEGARTNVARALDLVREDLRDQNLQSVLLISDGRYNTGSNPLYLAERYPVPIHTVAVGDTTSRRDLQIRRITTNDIAYVGTELPIQVTLRAEDFASERATVSLYQDGEMRASAVVDLPEGTTETPVDLAYVPETEGLQRFTVNVTRFMGEATYRNNRESFMVRILETKKRILLLGASPDPDLSAVRQLLAADPNLEVTSFIQKGPGTFYEGTLPDSLDAFDALVLAGFPGNGADANAVQRIVQAAVDGLPVLFLLGRRTDLGLLQRSFAGVLPATPQGARPTLSEITFLPTGAGLNHPVLEIPDIAELTWRRLPPLTYNESRWEASPDARVLATYEVRGVRLDDPLLVLRQRGNTRTAAFLAFGSWRWSNLPEDLANAEHFWPTLFSNLIQWITTLEDDRPVRVQPIADLFSGGESVQFTGQVYDESLNPVDGAALELVVTAPDSTRYPYPMESVGNGRYSVAVGALPEGTYRYDASARRNGVTLGTDQGEFAVGALTLEFKETQADVPLLRQVAARSDGRFLTTDETEELPAALDASGTFTASFVEEQRETELWHVFVFFIIVLALLSTEWFLRKRSGMV